MSEIAKLRAELEAAKAELEQAQAEWQAECIDKAKILAELEQAAERQRKLLAWLEKYLDPVAFVAVQNILAQAEVKK